MTHTESQDLLLDLAYGELDATRAAELESHLSGCAECRQEKAVLDEARRMAAPLRELEQPSPASTSPSFARRAPRRSSSTTGTSGR